MDFKTLKARIKKGDVNNVVAMEKEVMRMYANCVMSNRQGTEVWRMGREAGRDAEKDVGKWREVHGTADIEGGALQEDAGRGKRRRKN
jgi:hypothetical protein